MFLERYNFNCSYFKNGNGKIREFWQDFAIFYEDSGLRIQTLENSLLYSNIKSSNKLFLSACDNNIKIHSEEIDNFAKCADIIFERINEQFLTSSSFKNMYFSTSKLRMRILFYDYYQENTEFNIELDKGEWHPYVLSCGIFIPIKELRQDTHNFEKYNILMNKNIIIANMLFIDMYKNKNHENVVCKQISDPIPYDTIKKGFENFYKRHGLDNCIQDSLIKEFGDNAKQAVQEFLRYEHMLLDYVYDFQRNSEGLTFLQFGNIPEKYSGGTFKECLYD